MRADAWARGVSPEQAWAWWTDFQPGAVDHASFPLARRARIHRSVEERPDGTLRIEDEGELLGLRWREVSQVTLAKPRVRFDVRNAAGRFRGTYRFLPADGGTRIEASVEAEPARWLRWLGPPGLWAVRLFVAWDLRHHARDMERDLAP